MKSDQVNQWCVYIVRCSDNTLYTGIATDVERRISEHNNTPGGGARYTRSRQPVSLVYQEPALNRSQALKREYAIKCMSKQEKTRLITQAD